MNRHQGECQLKDSSGDRKAEEAVAMAESVDGWQPLTGSYMLSVGEVVKVDKTFQSADESLKVCLPVTSKGIVRKVDEDGDAQIRFPNLIGLRCKARWVLRSNFIHLSKYQRAEETQGVPSLHLSHVLVHSPSEEQIMPT